MLGFTLLTKASFYLVAMQKKLLPIPTLSGYLFFYCYVLSWSHLNDFIADLPILSLQFGRHVLEDIKAFVLESPNTSIGMDTEDDDDEEEDDLDDDDSDEGDEMGPIGIEEVEMFEFVYGDEAYLFMGGQIGSGLSGQFGGEQQQHGDISEPTGGQQQHAHPQQGFPRVARCRGNLTACSQRYNVRKISSKGVKAERQLYILREGGHGVFC